MCLCPLPWSDRGESRGKCSVLVRQEMTQDVVREVDREEEISQSDAEPVNETSTLQNVMTTLTWRLVKGSPWCHEHT